MPNVSPLELILLLVVLTSSVAFIVGVVWLTKRMVNGTEQTKIRELEARVQELEQRRR
ncbi:hypothetical protein [Deinococcus sp. AJ005]|uniref:hypothetical protein n=1 Tax=Deinococcus sp. AJ005 TaxID=2652443 RepID=UPI001865847F|nr:hypothetical protein [Deinococcus sp. AJ005]